jgi:hypothetical protein
MNHILCTTCLVFCVRRWFLWTDFTFDFFLRFVGCCAWYEHNRGSMTKNKNASKSEPLRSVTVKYLEVTLCRYICSTNNLNIEPKNFPWKMPKIGQKFLRPCFLSSSNFHLHMVWRTRNRSTIEIAKKSSSSQQSCQMVYFQTKNPNLGKFWRVLQCKMLVNFMAIWSILRPFSILYCELVHFVVLFWYIVPKNLATLVPRHKNFHNKRTKIFLTSN